MGPLAHPPPLGPRRLLSPERFQKIEKNFHDYGIRILLIARIMPGIRTPVFLSAGIVRLPFRKFLLADVLYAIPGVNLIFWLAYVLTDQFLKLLDTVRDYEKLAVVAILSFIAGFITATFVRRPVATGSPEELPVLGKPVVTIANPQVPESKVGDTAIMDGRAHPHRLSANGPPGAPRAQGGGARPGPGVDVRARTTRAWESDEGASPCRPSNRRSPSSPSGGGPRGTRPWSSATLGFLTLQLPPAPRRPDRPRSARPRTTRPRCCRWSRRSRSPAGRGGSIASGPPGSPSGTTTRFPNTPTTSPSAAYFEPRATGSSRSTSGACSVTRSRPSAQLPSSGPSACPEPVGFALAAIYTFLPYHAGRAFSHTMLAYYHTVPLVLLPTTGSCSAGCRSSPPPTRDGRRRLSLFNGTTAWTVLLAAVVAVTSPYYAFFGCFFLVVAGLYRGLSEHSWTAADRRAGVTAAASLGRRVRVCPALRARAAGARGQPGGRPAAPERGRRLLSQGDRIWSCRSAATGCGASATSRERTTPSR